MASKQLNIGLNRGRPRLWIEGKFLQVAGWNNGDRWNLRTGAGFMTLDKAIDGKRKVAGKVDRPIIDMVGKVLVDAFGADCAGMRVDITATKSRMEIVLCAKS